MDNRPPPPAPARRPPRLVLVGLAIAAAAVAACVGQDADVATVATNPTALLDQTTRSRPASHDLGPPPSTPGELGAADGVIPDGTEVSVFDDGVPAIGRLDPELRDALRAAAIDAEGDGLALRVNSGWRSAAHQQQLLDEAVAEHGSEEEAARWVATPETSLHVSGEAVDVGPPEAAGWLSDHGAAHGLCQIYDNEPWHFELRPEAVTDGCPARFADPTEDPRMQP